MKCLLVATESAEVLFFWTDAEFKQYIKEQYGTPEDDESGRVRIVSISKNKYFGKPFNSNNAVRHCSLWFTFSATSL